MTNISFVPNLCLILEELPCHWSVYAITMDVAQSMLFTLNSIANHPRRTLKTEPNFSLYKTLVGEEHQQGREVCQIACEEFVKSERNPLKRYGCSIKSKSLPYDSSVYITEANPTTITIAPVTQAAVT